MGKMKRNNAVEVVTSVLERHCWPGGVPSGHRCSIFLWEGNLNGAGVRVSEISFHSDRGGSSFMQSDRESWPLLFAVERHILNLMYFPEDVEDSAWQLDSTWNDMTKEKS